MIDPDFPKEQLVLLLREWYQHPNGQIPAYEWQLVEKLPNVRLGDGFAVSADGCRVLYVKYEAQVDLMLVEYFR